MALRVLILGGGLTAALMPTDLRWERWGLHACRTVTKDVDRWFELHQLTTLEPGERRDLLKGTYTQGKPVYTVRHYPRVPGSVVYPINEVAQGRLPLFTSSFAYMMGLAVYEGAREIAVAGIELERGSARERTVERLGLAYWVGVAEGEGIKVALADSGLFRYPRYGFDYWREVKAVRRELRALRGVLRRGEFDGLPRGYDERPS
jgi:hypothetical protein